MSFQNSLHLIYLILTDVGQGDSQANLHQYYLVYPDGNGSSLGKKVTMKKQYVERDFNPGMKPPRTLEINNPRLMKSASYPFTDYVSSLHYQ
jgi:hypothetical protein